MREQLTANFQRHEFRCPDCGQDDIDLGLVNMLQVMREGSGPLHITSGVRCKTHNKAVGGKPSSAHLKGLAVDILCKASRKRYLVVSEAIGAGFTRIGVGADFVHLDIAPGKAACVMWDYYK